MAWALSTTEQEKPLIMVATPHNGPVPYEFAAGLAVCNIPFDKLITGKKGGSIDLARNTCVTKMLQENCSHIFFVDSDIRLRSDTFTKLYDTDFPIISGLYKSRAPPFGLTAKSKGKSIDDSVINLKPSTAYQVEEVPAGCLLIDRRILLRLAAKINEWICIIDHRDDAGVEVIIYTDKEAIQNGYKCRYCKQNLICPMFQSMVGIKGIIKNAVSEDYYFSRQIASLGVPLMVHTEAFVEHYSAVGDFFISERGPITTTTNSGLT